MKRRVISVIVSLLMIIGAVYPALTVASAAVWGGETAIPSLSGDVYQIATAENLAWFASAVNSGTSSIKAVLTADIQLNSLGSKANEWTPIGTEEHPFTGTFDGAGHTISGVYINQPESLGVGLFGVIKNTNDEGKTASVTPEFIVQKKTILIQNLHVTDARINGYQNVGGIVGHSIGAGIRDCYFEGTVNGGYNSIGGVVGYADAETVVNQCYAASTVTGAQRTGGVVGYASSNSVISKCYATVDITGTSNVGGIAGTVSGSSLVGCFVFGSVTGTNRVGGVLGNSTVSVVRGAYAFAKINSTGANIGGAVGYIVSTAAEVIKGVARPIRVTANGITYDGDKTLICVCNGRCYGGFFNPMPNARVDDGALDCLVVSAVSRLTFAKLVGDYAKGRYAKYPKYIKYLRTDKMEIDAPEPLVVNLDGEAICDTHVEMTVVSGGLNFIFPKNMQYFKNQGKENGENEREEACSAAN